MEIKTYGIYWYNKQTHENTSIDLVDSTYLGWDGEQIERSFEEIIENAEYDTNDDEYFEIYDADDEYWNRLYTTQEREF